MEAIRILAQISIKLGVLDDAEILLENLLRMRPDYAEPGSNTHTSWPSAVVTSLRWSKYSDCYTDRENPAHRKLLRSSAMDWDEARKPCKSTRSCHRSFPKTRSYPSPWRRF